MPYAAEPQGTTAVFPVITSKMIRMEEQRYCLDWIEESLTKYQDQRRILREIENNYFVRTHSTLNEAIPRIGSGLAASFPVGKTRGARLKDPETHQIIESLAGQRLSLAFGGEPFIQAISLDEDPDKARFVGKLLEGAFSQPGMKGSFWMGFKESDTFGAAVYEVGWTSRSRMQMTEMPVFDEYGQPIGTQIAPQEVMYQNNLLLNLLDRMDLYPDAHGTRLHVNMPRFGKRFRISETDAMNLAKAGVYDVEATKLAIQVSRRESQGTDRAALDAFHDTTEVDLRPSPNKYLVGVEVWGEIPISYPDRAQNRVITLLEGQVVRSHINPFLDGRLPFAAIVTNPVPNRFFGLSPAEVVRYLQDSADNMLMVLNDAADMMVKPVLLVGQGFGGDVNRLRRREFNDVIQVGDVEKVKELLTNTTALSIAADELMRRKLGMREASGATNPLQSVPSGDRQTATEISELVRLASQRVDVSHRVVEEDQLPIFAMLAHSRLRQFLPPEGAIAVVGGKAVRVSLDQLDTEVSIKFVGSRQAVSLAQKAANHREFLSVLGANIDTMMYMPEPFISYGRDVLGFPNAEEIVMKAIQRRVAVLQAQMQAQKQEEAQSNQQGAGQQQPLGTQSEQAERGGQRMA